jgi:hypothetical protein
MTERTIGPYLVYSQRGRWLVALRDGTVVETCKNKFDAIHAVRRLCWQRRIEPHRKEEGHEGR